MPRRVSDAERYLRDISDGKVVTSAKMRLLAGIMLPRFESGYKQWHFDIDAAERPVKFIERFCKQPTGEIGQPLLLTDYEKCIVETVFGFVDDDGIRQFQEALVIIGRKNGKTTLMAALELYMLMADHEGAPQVYNVASSKDQASLGYGAMLKMARQSPEISKHTHKGIIPDRHADGLMFDRNMGYITPLSAQTKHLDGLDVHCAIIDELSVIVNRDLYDLVKQGMAARKQPLLMCITTNGFVRGGIFDTQYSYASDWLEGKVEDDMFIPFVWELDDRSEWDAGPEVWKKANPGLGVVKKVKFLENLVNKAKQEPDTMPTLLTKDFNIPENAAAAWLRFDEAVNKEKVGIDDIGFDYCIVGVDTSDSVDLTSAQALMMRSGDDRIYVKSMYWIPESVIAERENSGERSSRDDVPYDMWVKRGLMRTIPGNKINNHVVVEWIMELKEQGIYTYAVGVDPWHMDDNILHELELTVGTDRVFLIRQGAKTLSQPMKVLRADYRAKRIVDDDNPVNQWCRMNVSVKVDVNDNIQPVKKLNNPKNRIDGFMAELDAYVTLQKVREDYLAMVKWEPPVSEGNA